MIKYEGFNEFEEPDESENDTDKYDSGVYSYSNEIKIEFDTAFPTEYKKFEEEDYKKLNENLLLYKQGNAEAAQYIISVFHRFIKNYVDFITYGNYYNKQEEEEITKQPRRQYDKSLTRFIGLFISKESRETAKNSLERNALFATACVKIQKIFSKFEYWDIYNELTCTLLNMANKYKIAKEGDKYYKKNGTFHMYVSRCFHFDAYNALAKISGDPLAHLEVHSLDKNYKNPSFNDYTGNFYDILKDTSTDRAIDHMIAKANRQMHLNNCEDSLVMKEEGIDPYDMDSLNFNWTNGNACSELFKCLSSYERELLVMSFAQNKTDAEIANIYGCHRITIIKYKKNAVEKIKAYLKENPRLKEDLL